MLGVRRSKCSTLIPLFSVIPGIVSPSLAIYVLLGGTIIIACPIVISGVRLLSIISLKSEILFYSAIVESVSPP